MAWRAGPLWPPRAGARRTETAYPRFVQAQKGYDLVTGGFPEKLDPERTLTRMAAMPEVLEWARLDVVAYAAILPSGRRVSIPELAAVTDLTGRVGYRLNRFKVVSGRMADLRAPDEAMINFPTADQQNLSVGSTVRFVLGDPSANPQRLATVRIVGIVASPGAVPGRRRFIEPWQPVRDPGVRSIERHHPITG